VGPLDRDRAVAARRTGAVIGNVYDGVNVIVGVAGVTILALTVLSAVINTSKSA
jgi:hypothetical protein